MQVFLAMADEAEVWHDDDLVVDCPKGEMSFLMGERGVKPSDARGIMKNSIRKRLEKSWEELRRQDART